MRKTITLDSREAEKLIEFMRALVMIEQLHDGISGSDQSVMTDEAREDAVLPYDLSEAAEWERLLVDKLYERRE